MGALLTITETAHHVGRSRQFVYRLIARGLPVRRFDPRGMYYVDALELDAWLRGQTPRRSVEPLHHRAATRTDECARLKIPVEHEFS